TAVPGVSRRRPRGRKTATATGRCPRRCDPIQPAADVAGGQELLVSLAAHLRPHFVEAVAGGRANLQQVVDVGAGIDQALEISLADQRLLILGEAKARHERLLVALESLTLLRRAEGGAELVQPPTAARETQV